MDERSLWEASIVRCSKSSIQNDIYIYKYNLYIYVADVAGYIPYNSLPRHLFLVAYAALVAFQSKTTLHTFYCHDILKAASQVLERTVIKHCRQWAQSSHSTS